MKSYIVILSFLKRFHPPTITFASTNRPQTVQLYSTGNGLVTAGGGRDGHGRWARRFRRRIKNEISTATFP